MWKLNSKMAVVCVVSILSSRISLSGEVGSNYLHNVIYFFNVLTKNVSLTLHHMTHNQNYLFVWIVEMMSLGQCGCEHLTHNCTALFKLVFSKWQNNNLSWSYAKGMIKRVVSTWFSWTFFSPPYLSGLLNWIPDCEEWFLTLALLPMGLKRKIGRMGAKTR